MPRDGARVSARPSIAERRSIGASNRSGAFAVMQPYFFPYVGYFRLLAAVCHFGRKVAAAKRLHRLDDGGDAVGEVAHQIHPDADAADDAGSDDP